MFPNFPVQSFQKRNMIYFLEKKLYRSNTDKTSLLPALAVLYFSSYFKHPEGLSPAIITYYINESIFQQRKIKLKNAGLAK